MEKSDLSSGLFVVISRLHKLNSINKHPVDNPVLMVDSPAPAPGKIVPQRFRFADSGKRISQNG